MLVKVANSFKTSPRALSRAQIRAHQFYCDKGRAPTRTAAGRLLVTSGAAFLIVSAFRRVRRSTSTDALQTCGPGRAGVQLLAEALHVTGPSDLLHADHAGARPYLF